MMDARHWLSRLVGHWSSGSRPVHTMSNLLTSGEPHRAAQEQPRPACARHASRSSANNAPANRAGKSRPQSPAELQKARSRYYVGEVTEKKVHGSPVPQAICDRTREPTPLVPQDRDAGVGRRTFGVGLRTPGCVAQANPTILPAHDARPQCGPRARMAVHNS